MPNTLYYGDTLDVLRRHVGDDTGDLVYLPAAGPSVLAARSPIS